MTSQDDPISTFKSITGANESVAKYYLSQNNNNVEQAITSYYNFQTEQKKNKNFK